MTRNESQKVLIVGSDSTVGIEICNLLQDSNIDYVTTTRRQRKSPHTIKLDLNNISTLHELDLFGITDAFIFAGNTDIKSCENDPIGSHLINVERIVYLCQILLKENIRIIFISSTCVFSEKSTQNNEFSVRMPSNNYGKQKKIVEDYLIEHGNSIIVRSTKILSKNNPLILKWSSSLLQNTPISAATDLYVAPICLTSFCIELISLLSFSDIPSIIHFSSSHQITYFDLAISLCKSLQLNANNMVKPISQNQIADKLVYKPIDASLICNNIYSKIFPINIELSKIFMNDSQSQ